MTTVLQIILILALIALIGIILGYILGKIGCKKRDNSKYVEKSNICEESYKDNVIANREELAENKGAESAAESVATATAAQSLVGGKDSEADVSIATDSDTASKDLNSADATQESAVTKTQSLVDTENNEGADDGKELAIAKDSDGNSDSSLEDTQSEDDTADKPAGLLEPRDGKPDNLCRIKGVGTVIEAKLHNLGIYHFDQIAVWTEREIAWVDKHLAFSGRIVRENWIEQAALLAKGEETEFSKRVDKGEVETSRKS